MRPTAQTRPADTVLHLRGVVKVLRAGLAGCSASARVLAGVDLSIRRGERVTIVDAPPDAGTLLLLIAAGLVRPDAGDAWCAPGARLGRREPARGAVRGVAERAAAGVELLSWPAGAGARLLLGDGRADEGLCGARRLCFHRGVLRPAWPARRVDSPVGAL
jgi:hypothetical protein